MTFTTNLLTVLPEWLNRSWNSVSRFTSKYVWTQALVYQSLASQAIAANNDSSIVRKTQELIACRKALGLLYFALGNYEILSLAKVVFLDFSPFIFLSVCYLVSQHLEEAENLFISQTATGYTQSEASLPASTVCQYSSISVSHYHRKSLLLDKNAPTGSRSIILWLLNFCSGKRISISRSSFVFLLILSHLPEESSECSYSI